MDDSIFKKVSPYHTVSGKNVYSGGGIMPDIFVPADTTEDTNLIEELTDDELFTAFVVEKLQPTLAKYDSADDFIKSYSVSRGLYGDFILYASQTIKEMDSNDIRTSEQPVKTLLKAYAARFKWGDEAYYQAINCDDEALKKAVAALK